MRILAVIMLGLALVACQMEERPEGIMERDEFKEALLDAQLVEARMNHEMILEQMKTMPVQKYYEELFERHQITEEQFQETFNYYTEHPDELKAIYEEIMTELTLRKDNSDQ